MSQHQDALPQDDKLKIIDLDLTDHSPTPSLGQLDKFPEELLITIATNLTGIDVYILGQVNSVFLKLFFNQTRNRIAKVLLPYKMSGKKQKLNNFTTLNQKSVASEYRKDELDQQVFSMVQERIWKPLVCHYFPRFNTGLNVKNWMHVLRKRIAHLQVNSQKHLPLRKHEPIKKLQTEPVKNDRFLSPFEWSEQIGNMNPYEIEGIENCEWIYKCPMKYESMIQDDSEKRFCTTCGKHVYKVYQDTEVKAHSDLGHCIVMLKYELPIPPVLGLPIWIPPPTQ